MTRATARPSPRFTPTLLTASLLLAFHGAGAQQTPTDNAIAKASEEPAPPAVVVLGSRSTARTALDSAAPVGLIGQKDMQMAGPLDVV